jgi:hypothetical protein
VACVTSLGTFWHFFFGEILHGAVLQSRPWNRALIRQHGRIARKSNERYSTVFANQATGSDCTMPGAELHSNRESV